MDQKPVETQPAPVQTKAPKKTEVKPPKEEPAPQNIKIRNRHDAAFRHDIFMSDAKEAARNVSYKHLEPNIVHISHKHVYHSHNNQGKKLSRTNSALGHWHNIDHYIDAKGNIVAKCGPPMHAVQKQSETGKVFDVIEQVSYDKEEQTGPDAGKIIRIVDSHTHEMTYMGSEELSANTIREMLDRDKQEAVAYGVSFGASAVKDQTPAPLTAQDGVTME